MSIHTQPPPKKSTVRRVKKTVRVKRKPGVDRLPERKPYGKPPHVKKREREEKRARQHEALELRMAGATYKDIAVALNYKSPSSAKFAVDAAIQRTEMDAAKEVVALDLSRLDEFQMRCMHALRNNGDLSQIDRLMRIMEMRYRLLGVSDETVRQLQSEHGISTTINNKNNVMVINAAPETEDEFIKKMMGAVGVNPDSPEAQQYLESREARTSKGLPMLAGSANETKQAAENARTIEDEDIVEAELVEEDD